MANLRSSRAKKCLEDRLAKIKAINERRFPTVKPKKDVKPKT